MKKTKSILSLFLILVLGLCIPINASAYSGYAYSIGGEFFSGQDVISAADY